MQNRVKWYRALCLMAVLALSMAALLGCSQKSDEKKGKRYTVLLRDDADGTHYSFDIKQSECEEHQLPMIARWQESGKRITTSVGTDPESMTAAQRKELLIRALALYAAWEDSAADEGNGSAAEGSEQEPAPDKPSQDGGTPALQNVTLKLQDVASKQIYECTFDVTDQDDATKALLRAQSAKGVLSMVVSKDVSALTQEEKQQLLCDVIAKLKYVVPAKPKATVFVDAGHGYTNSYGVMDKGAGENTPYFALTGKYESDVNLAIALVLKEKLEMAGYRVIMSREAEVNEPLHINDRARMIKNSGADFAVSVHCNSFDDPSVNGARVYWHENNGSAAESEALAELLANAINGVENTTNEEAYATQGSYAVVRDVHIPSVLVETCFLTGEADAKLVSDGTWVYRMAQALLNGIESGYTIGK